MSDQIQASTRSFQSFVEEAEEAKKAQKRRSGRVARLKPEHDPECIEYWRHKTAALYGVLTRTVRSLHLRAETLSVDDEIRALEVWNSQQTEKALEEKKRQEAQNEAQNKAMEIF